MILYHGSNMAKKACTLFFFRVFTGDRVFDVIAGAVADDRTVDVINQYMNGLKIPVRILTA